MHHKHQDGKRIVGTKSKERTSEKEAEKLEKEIESKKSKNMDSRKRYERSRMKK